MFGEFLPNGAVDIDPPDLAPWQVAKYDSENQTWIIEEDPTGRHCPELDTNASQTDFFVFDEHLTTNIPTLKCSLRSLRLLARNGICLMETESGEMPQKFFGRDAHNRIVYLMDNLGFLSHEMISFYKAWDEGIAMHNFSLIKFKTKFYTEQASYCMKLILDYLIQITCFRLFENLKVDSLGKYLAFHRKDNPAAIQIHNLIFKRLTSKHIELLKHINNIANSYKHSFLQGQADALYSEQEPAIIAIAIDASEKLDKPIRIIHSEYRQVLAGFYSCIEEVIAALEKKE